MNRRQTVRRQTVKQQPVKRQTNGQTTNGQTTNDQRTNGQNATQGQTTNGQENATSANVTLSNTEYLLVEVDLVVVGSVGFGVEGVDELQILGDLALQAGTGRLQYLVVVEGAGAGEGVLTREQVDLHHVSTILSETGLCSEQQSSPDKCPAVTLLR